MNGAVKLQNNGELETVSSFNPKEEFEKRRWVLITNVPDGVDLEVTHVLLGAPEQAVTVINSLNRQSFHGCVLGVSLAPPDSLLFVGNLPFEFKEEQFRSLMSPFGPIERIFLVRSMFTGESKGYGFVDYVTRESACLAKQQLMNTGSKYVGGRILRVNFAEPNLLTYEDLHSKTLFVDRLPRDFTNGEVLKELFSQSGSVTFAQVAVNPQTGISRGFAFVDYGTAEEAERGQKAHNGALLEGTNIRVAYGTPGRTGASILGGQNTNVGGQSSFGPRPRGPAPHAPQGLDMMAARGPRPLMAPRPLMGSEPWQQMPRGHPGRSPRPLRPGLTGPRFAAGRPRGPGPGGARGPPFGHAPRPLMGRPPGARPMMRHPAGPRGFAGMGVGGPPGVRPVAPRGVPLQPRPLMDFGEQPDGTGLPPEQMQQHIGETPIPALMSEPMGGGIIPPAAEQGVFGPMGVQPMLQQQEVLVPAPPQQQQQQQQQGMLVPSPLLGPRSAVPQLMQLQTAPSAPVPAYPGTMQITQSQVALMPQSTQQPIMVPAQQVPNNQPVMYAAPSALPAQTMVPQVLHPDPAPLMATPGTVIAGQTDPNTVQYSSPGVQQIAQGDPAPSGAANSGYVVLPADATQQTTFYAPQETQSYTLPQSVPGLTTQQPMVQLPMGSVQPTAIIQPQVSTSQPSSIPAVAPPAPQYQWYQQMPPAVGSVAVSTPQAQTAPLQATSVGGIQWGQAEQASQPLMTVSSSGMYGQFQTTQQYQPQQAVTPGSEAMVYYQQPQLGQKRAAEGETGQYALQGPPSYYDSNKRLRY
ncbi:hypothetical protein pdam_00002277 [Pocillopora damicornis]|uniref:RRM domain-containing protein n=1 Tax=Pocillopora damicornis TaxID=46731 RepID=A0A3M6TF88_POCDA|nr:hypothetical protein pdam_00002277 [Pocillopora damicornis]